MNALVQIDGKPLSDRFQGTVRAKRVVVIGGKLINIVTRIPRRIIRVENITRKKVKKVVDKPPAPA